MRVQALVITEALYVQFDVPKGTSDDEIKRIALTTSEGMEGTWKPEVRDIIREAPDELE